MIIGLQIFCIYKSLLTLYFILNKDHFNKDLNLHNVICEVYIYIYMYILRYNLSDSLLCKKNEYVIVISF